MKRKTLLTIDGIVNLLLGLLLMVFPRSLVAILGLPPSDPGFYPNILGGVLFGIGIALMMESRSGKAGGDGLSLCGAAAINLCGGLVLGAWLLFGNLRLPQRGTILLWLLVAILVGISIAEISGGPRTSRKI